MKNYFFYVLLICTVCFISCTKENEEESGSQSTIVSKLKSSTVSDIDGNVYNTVTIGDQTWMVENLKVTRYYDGTSISNVTDNESWNSLSTPAYCWYNNDESYKSTYGALYNWYAANSGKLAPKGWHIPNETEWNELFDYLGGSDVAGEKMKLAIGLGASWDNTATNESGFSALPAGNRGNNGVFGNLSLMASFWNSGEYATWGGIRTYLAGTTSVYSVPFNKPMGASVRCIKD